MNYKDKSFWGTEDEEEAESLATFVAAAAVAKFGTAERHNLHEDSRFTARKIWEKDVAPDRAANILVWTKR